MTRIDLPGTGVTAIPSGDFEIYGLAPYDTIALGGVHTDYSFGFNNSGVVMSSSQGTDALYGVERIEFGDGYALGFDLHVEQGYRLYAAALDRAPDDAGLGYHVRDLDAGLSLSDVALQFISSPEYRAKYGATTDAQFLTLLYENVLNREPDSGGLQYHLDEFAHGASRADMLTHFSESPEARDLFMGQTGHGVWFVY